MPVPTRTAQEAADAMQVAVDQIAKSIILQATDGPELFLFITAGSNRVDLERAAQVAGRNMRPAKPEIIRARTGFAIGGVAPIGHLQPIPAWLDPKLVDFPQIWAAGGTPNHMFAIAPDALIRLACARITAFATPPG